MASKMKEDLSCPVCTDIYKDPVVLTCSHSFCKDCLKKCWETKPSRECPVCRRRSSKMEPPLNLVLRNLCETYLQEKDADTSQTGAVCSLHGDPLRLFCHTDQKLVCFSCRDSKLHQNHNFSPISEAAADRKEELKINLDPMKENLKVFEDAQVNCSKMAEHIKTQAQHTELQIKREFEKLHQFLRDEEAARIAALREEEEQKSQMMKEKIEKMSTDLSSLSNGIRAIEEQMEADDVTFLQNYKSIVERAHTLQNPERVSGALINVAKHLGNLKFRVWEKMQEIVQYTPVTLDLNTAHPQLKLSEDLTSVSLSDSWPQPLDNPERFDHFASVLGSEGFNSGTHCWDVEVGESTGWEVGVKTESGPRKGKYDDDVSGEWRVVCNDGKYTTCDLQEFDTPLPVKQKPQRIRVQLDWDRGALSFSDPDNNTCLRTFTHAFTERVFPYLSTVCPLKILPMKVSVALEQHSFCQ